MNYYDILEVNQNSSLSVIRAAYRALMQKYHPDKNINNSISPEINDKALLIQEAFNVLSDELRRKEYDKSLLNSHKESDKKEEEKPKDQSSKASDLVNINSSAIVKTPTSESGVGPLFLGVIVYVILVLVATIGGNNNDNTPAFNALPKTTTTPSEPVSIAVGPTEKEKKAQEQKEAEELAARTIPVFAKDIKIAMPPSEEGYSYCMPSIGVYCNYSIVIPELTLVLYNNDVTAVSNHIKSNSNLLIDRVRFDLSKTEYTEFTSVDGERRLRDFIKKTVNKIILENPYSYEKKGVEDVIFHKSFRITKK